MAFGFNNAKDLARRIQREYKGKVTRVQLSKLLRETTNCMDPRWIRTFAMSMASAGLIKEVSDGVFEVISDE